MLARHLLFLATRRPKNAFVIQPNEPPSKSMYSQQQIHQQQQPIQRQYQPSLYIDPTKVKKFHKDYSCPVIYNKPPPELHLKNNLQAQLRQNLPISKQDPIYHYQSHPHRQQPNVHYLDPYDQLNYDKNNFHQPRTHSNYSENQAIYTQQLPHPLQMYNKVNQQQFYTLPNRKIHREVIAEPTRSITPDITRGLSRGSLSAVNMLARQPRKSHSADKLVTHNYHQTRQNYHDVLNPENLEAECKSTVEKQLPKQTPVDVKNRFTSPLGFSAVGYRFFTPAVKETKEAPISPICPSEHSHGFRSSTPTSPSIPTVAERLALQSQRCASPNPALMQHTYSEKNLLTLSDSGRDTPTNFAFAPIKSTMSNEELFAAIHKSKRRLKIKNDSENLPPARSVAPAVHNQQVIGTRHSWSPESQKVPEVCNRLPTNRAVKKIPKTILSPAATSRMDFKRLLLQQSIKAGPTRISATEQLKLSRQQCQEQQQQQTNSPTKPSQQSSLNKVLSPRSAWRFQTPRTDVLSSTIIEDTVAEEKAMKPSPENPVKSASTARKQIDFSNEKDGSVKNFEESKNTSNDSSQRILDKRDKELENRLQAIDMEENKKKLESDNVSAAVDIENPLKAIENRRMNNQLARAKFLASSAHPEEENALSKDLFKKRFRARSESPQQKSQETPAASSSDAVVPRSPSAPALETAL